MSARPQPQARVSVRVTPRSSKDEVLGLVDGTLHVRVTAPPDGGRANAAVCMLVARELGVAKSLVSVVRGATARRKVLVVEGLDADAVAAALGGPRET